MKNNFFPERPQIEPTIYVYELTGVDSHKGFVKVGYTERDVKERIKEQLKIETDIKKQEEINDLIIKIKKGSED